MHRRPLTFFGRLFEGGTINIWHFLALEVQKEGQIHPNSVKNQAKSIQNEVLEPCGKDLAPKCVPRGSKMKTSRAFGLHFGGQNRTKIDSKLYQILDQILEGIFDGFWVDFGPIFEAFFGWNDDQSRKRQFQ